MGYTNNPSARRIITSRLMSVEKPANKYNLALQQKTADDLGLYLADERGGCDTGMQLQTNY